MVDLMKDRCRRICGSKIDTCYVNSTNQLRCITDMVINKTTAVSMSLGMSLRDSNPEKKEEKVKRAIYSSNELSNWIKYLQLVGDLRELSSLVLDSDTQEKRTEIRYPMSIAADNIMIHTNGYSGRIINFSQSGVLFISDKPMKLDDSFDASLVLNTPLGKKIPFKFKARHQNKLPDGTYATGCLIKEVYGNTLFNFFNEVYHLMIDIRWNA